MLWGLKNWMELPGIQTASFSSFWLQSHGEVSLPEPPWAAHGAAAEPVVSRRASEEPRQGTRFSLVFLYLGLAFWFPFCLPVCHPPIVPSVPCSLANRAASSAEPSPGESAGLVPCKQRRAGGGGR